MPRVGGRTHRGTASRIPAVTRVMHVEDERTRERSYHVDGRWRSRRTVGPACRMKTARGGTGKGGGESE